jgi:LysM repeat protein
MSKFQKLAQINKIANECVQDGDFVLASKFHNEFMKIAQNQSEAKYVVDAGDSLALIVKKYAKKGLRTSVQKIMQRNNLTESTLYPGSTLYIPLEGNPMQPGIDEQPMM